MKRVALGLMLALSAVGPVFAQAVAPGDQLRQILAMAALQRFELGDPLLQLGQVLRIALEGGAVAIEVAGQVM